MLQSVQQPPLGLFNLLHVWFITYAGFLSVETGQCSPTEKRRRRLSCQIITVTWKKSTTCASRWNARGAAFRCCFVWENLGCGWGKSLLFSAVYPWIDGWMDALSIAKCVLEHLEALWKSKVIAVDEHPRSQSFLFASSKIKSMMVISIIIIILKITFLFYMCLNKKDIINEKRII